MLAGGSVAYGLCQNLSNRLETTEVAAVPADGVVDLWPGPGEPGGGPPGYGPVGCELKAPGTLKLALIGGGRGV